MFLKCCCCSIAQSCPSLGDSMDCTRPGFPVLKISQSLAQSHVHRVSDAIQPFHHLSSPSPPAFNLSQAWGLFQWVGFSHHVAKVYILKCISVLIFYEYFYVINFSDGFLSDIWNWKEILILWYLCHIKIFRRNQKGWLTDILYHMDISKLRLLEIQASVLRYRSGVLKSSPG